MSCGRASLLGVGGAALVGSLFILDMRIGLLTKPQSLRGARRLQEFGQFGNQIASNGGRLGGNMANQAGQYSGYGGNVANQAEQYGSYGGNLANQAGQYGEYGGGLANRMANIPTFGSVLDVVPTELKATIILLQARAAHTFDRTGTLEYWCGLLAMFLCPFCTLCYTNACTDLNPKLGGEYANPISSALCTWCCFCCTIAQDAESLDAATGSQTEMCGVSGGMPPMGMGGPGMYPPQMMMQQPYY